jgi:hypothetical protein
MEKVLNASPEGFNELLRAFESEAGDVDDGIGLEGGDALSEGAGGFFGFAIENGVGYFVPGSVGLVRFALVAADADDVVSGLYEAGGEVSADVAAAADDRDSHAFINACGRREGGRAGVSV